MTTLTVQRFPSRAALDQALAERLGVAIAAPGAAPAVMLSGGTTPLPAYRALAARAPARAAGLRVLFTDERYVPADSPASNFHQLQPLLEALALGTDALLRVRTELDLEAAAADYERRLAALLACGASIRLGLLGLGAEGHTASLFGSADLERARGHLALSIQRPDGMAAVSVTPEFLARVSEPVFVVAGSGKHDAVRRLLSQDATLTAWRAVQGCARAQLWMDPAAEQPPAP